MAEKVVAKVLVLHHKDSSYTIEFEPELGMEVLKYQIYSLTSILPDDQQILGLNLTDELSDDDALLLSNLQISNGGHITVVEKEKNALSLTTSAAKPPSAQLTDEELARLLQAEEDAMYIKEQEDIAKKNMEARLGPYCKQVLSYEDSERQDAARNSVPLVDLEEKTAIALAKEGKFEPTKDELDHFLLLQLLFWFKQSFRWIDSPACAMCGHLKTDHRGHGTPNAEELRFGGNRVELFSCSRCGAISRFPRYNDPMKLLETRSGRCGEWANCFTFYCRALGYKARLVIDFTDHVWTECFSTLLGRWVHLDPCESAFDKPLLYESGWRKQLNYVFAFANDGVYDVTKRYTQNFPQVLSRRNMLSESALHELLVSLTSRLRRSFPVTQQIELQCLEREDFQTMNAFHEESLASLQGRQSGSLEWRTSRGETSTRQSVAQTSKSPYPKRLCVDEHVGKIFKAIGQMCYDVSATGLLKASQKLLHLLRMKPYKTRHIKIDEQEMIDGQAVINHGSVHSLFEALGFRFDHENEEIWLRLNEIPSKAALALPVAMELLDSTLADPKGDSCSTDTKKSMLKSSLEGTRLASGLTLASGEEPPLGIATSAFDGLHSTKWEEPDGANGAYPSSIVTFKWLPPLLNS